MLSFKSFLQEQTTEKGGLTIFDIDDTLFHTTAKVAVKKEGKVVRELTNQEFNDYKLKQGEEFDFGQFRSAKKFKEESRPIEKMFAKARAILKNTENKPNSKVIIVTARDDFDDKKVFLNTFRKYGFNIDKVRVERAGKIGGDYIPAIKKAIIIHNYLKTGVFARVRLIDDSMTNLKEFLRLQNTFPDIRFEAFYAKPDGSVKVVR
jgi:anion-transporting  ArsA/GET3 family ATPase